MMIAPVTSRGREAYPTRVRLNVGDVDGWIVLDQIRMVDKARLCDKIGVLEAAAILNVKCTIKEMLVE
nr:type II toxin-antitoxin system PemK/MazF family toxin [Desulfosporosinus nitroreducens]